MLRQAVSTQPKRNFRLFNRIVLCVGYATLLYWLIRGAVALLVLLG